MSIPFLLVLSKCRLDHEIHKDHEILKEDDHDNDHDDEFTDDDHDDEFTDDDQC